MVRGMKRNFNPVILLVIACLSIGCLTVAVPVNTPTPPPTTTSPLILPSQTSVILPSPTSIPLAPLCSEDPLTGACPTPKVGTLSKFCVKKLPYTLLGTPPGSTYEVMDSRMTCKDEGIRGEVRQVSCTGQQLYSFEIKVCDTACYAAQLKTGTGQCPDGYGYSAGAGCCWPTSALEAGCVIYKVDIGACQ
jgi:hypothetical protein